MCPRKAAIPKEVKTPQAKGVPIIFVPTPLTPAMPASILSQPPELLMTKGTSSKTPAQTTTILITSVTTVALSPFLNAYKRATTLINIVAKV